LIEEAKKTLFRLLATQPKFKPAQELLKKVEEIELKDIFKESRSVKRPIPVEDIEAVIESLDRDLNLGIADAEQTAQLAEPQWTNSENLSAREFLDLGVAYFEMGCYADALRELQKAEKKVRIEESFLGETGLAAAALIARCLLLLERAYEARAYLEPILIEPDLKHEDKIILYYEMGVAEQDLGNLKAALSWFEKVSESDFEFKDVSYRLRQLRKPSAKR
jgi:tetratricopeptide (TPR) repeat protein